MKKLVAIVLAIALVFALVACGGIGDDSGETDNLGDVATDEQMRLGCGVSRAEEQSGDVFFIFYPGTRDTVHDKLLVLRGSSPNDLNVIAELSDEPYNPGQLYIDKGAAGMGHYYAAVAVSGGVTGIPSSNNIIQSQAYDDVRWYIGNGGHLRVDLPTLEYGSSNSIPGNSPDHYIHSQYSYYAFFDGNGVWSANPEFTAIDIVECLSPYSDFGFVCWSDTAGMELNWDYELRSLSYQDGLTTLVDYLIVNESEFRYGRSRRTTYIDEYGDERQRVATTDMIYSVY